MSVGSTTNLFRRFFLASEMSVSPLFRNVKRAPASEMSVGRHANDSDLLVVHGVSTSQEGNQRESTTTCR
jgi:hypothetical protein